MIRITSIEPSSVGKYLGEQIFIKFETLCLINVYRIFLNSRLQESHMYAHKATGLALIFAQASLHITASRGVTSILSLGGVRGFCPASLDLPCKSYIHGMIVHV